VCLCILPARSSFRPDPTCIPPLIFDRSDRMYRYPPTSDSIIYYASLHAHDSLYLVPHRAPPLSLLCRRIVCGFRFHSIIHLHLFPPAPPQRWRKDNRGPYMQPDDADLDPKCTRRATLERVYSVCDLPLLYLICGRGVPAHRQKRTDADDHDQAN